MSLLMRFPEIVEESRRLYETWKEDSGFPDFHRIEHFSKKGRVTEKREENYLVCGDNAACMRWMAQDTDRFGELKLIYVDPPFFTCANYGAELKLKLEKTEKIPPVKQKAYHDTWENGMEEYLIMLGARFFFMRDLLAEDGCLWVHLDWHAVHYVKVLLDEIFGESNFVNEVVWQYKSGGVSKRTFARKHDTLLFYAKTKKYYFSPQKEKSYNRGLKPYRFKGVKEYRDENGWYTLVNRKDVWQIDMVGRTSSERTGYATQKPEALLMRILESCTKEGDLCADFFGGSGTLASAAEKMGRRWLTCDFGRLAAVNAYRRMASQNASFSCFEEITEKKEEEQPHVQITALKRKDVLSGEELLSVEISSYDPGLPSSLPVDDKYLPVIREAAEVDPFQFISCWSLDCRYNGTDFCPDVFFSRNGEKLELCYVTMGCGFESAALRIQDLFGRSVFLVLKPEWVEEEPSG